MSGDQAAERLVDLPIDELMEMLTLRIVTKTEGWLDDDSMGDEKCARIAVSK